jgi:two-component system, chemotaxis family, chemotaxis protein CheY
MDPLRRINATMLEERRTSGPLKILIADDDTEMTALLKTLLVNHFECEIVRNGSAVLSYLRNHEPDLLLLDVNMPGMNGFEVLRAIRSQSQFRHLRIALLTGEADPQYIHVAAAIGADGYIVKPFKVRTLLQRVRSILSSDVSSQ